MSGLQAAEQLVVEVTVVEEVVHCVVHDITKEETSEVEVIADEGGAEEQRDAKAETVEEEDAKHSSEGRRESEARGVGRDQVMDAVSKVVEDVSVGREDFVMENPAMHTVLDCGPSEGAEEP